MISRRIRYMFVMALGIAPFMQVSAQKSGGTTNAPPRPFIVETHEELQSKTLPPFPPGMTIGMLVEGDQLFHGKGGCFACHGAEAQGLPAAGDALTSSLSYARYEWRSIDSLITAGMPDAQTRSPIAMPARGARGDLTTEQVALLAAYVWAISQVRGEPWPGGHTSHAGLVPAGATEGTEQRKPWTTRGNPATHRERESSTRSLAQPSTIR